MKCYPVTFIDGTVAGQKVVPVEAVESVYDSGYEAGYRAALYGVNQYIFNRLAEHNVKEKE